MMMPVEPTSRSFFKPTYRLSQEKPRKVFAGWEKFLIASQYIDFQSVKQFSRSILGKVIIFTVAEACGAYCGSQAGKLVVGKISLTVGKWLFPVITSMVGTWTIYQIANKISGKIHHLFLALSSIFSAYILSQSLIHIADFGAVAGLQLGEQVGGYMGTVLGGFGGLYLAGSPIVFWDKEDLWSCYCVCMARYLAVQIILDLHFGTQLNPILAIFMSVLTFPLRNIAPTLAYNSNIIIPALNCLREDGVPKKSLTAITIQLITNKISGKNTKYGPNLNKKIYSTLEPAFLHMESSSSDKKNLSN